jgi:hypothetical protein
VERKLLSLRQSDILTTNKLARDVELDLGFAETLVADLVNEGILGVVIVVGCKNDEYSHPLFFYSFEEYYNASQYLICDECGQPIDFKNAKIGFTRGNF